MSHPVYLSEMGQLHVGEGREGRPCLGLLASVRHCMQLRGPAAAPREPALSLADQKAGSAGPDKAVGGHKGQSPGHTAKDPALPPWVIGNSGPGTHSQGANLGIGLLVNFPSQM